VNLLVLPDDGLAPVVHAIRRARQSVRVTIFRCDLPEIEKALGEAVTRGVAVHALIAHTNRAGEKLLRKLELRLLGMGVTVSRTADDLVRYHDKMMIVDERVLFVLGFNFTRTEVMRRRSLGVVTRQREIVSEALRLFEADATRQPFAPAARSRLVVSPLGARGRIARFVQSARSALWIYDPHVTDRPMIRLVRERIAAGVDVRILGKATPAVVGLPIDLPASLDVHVRALLRDDAELFVGSQGLRTLELDRRREVGVLVRDRSAIKRFRAVFEADWATTRRSAAEAEKAAKEEETAAVAGEEADAAPALADGAALRGAAV